MALVAAACVSPLKRDEELAALLSGYHRQNVLVAERRQAQTMQGIKALTVTPAPEGGVVRADVEGAVLSTVVRRILDESKVAHVIQAPLPFARVTARFDRLPVAQALQHLVEPHDLAVVVRDGVVVLKEADAAPRGALPADGAAATREVALRHLDLEGAQRLLDSLYPRSPATGSRRVEFGQQASTNSVTLLGAPADVARAATVLRQADRENAHIVIEALVVEFEASAFERLATTLQNFANQQFSGLATAIGSVAGRAVSFTYTRGANNTLAYTAIIDVLVSTQQARLVSRPYLATMSGRAANIQITRDRYVVVQTALQGATVTSAAPVTSGVIMKITPVALPDGRIQMSVDVEDSVFLSNDVNVSAEVDKNRAATTMQVESGQAIIIGGLVLNQRTGTNAGLPWLRHIPLLNLAFANQEGDERKQEVMIFLTPYLWTPDLAAPLPAPDAFTIKDLDGRIGNTERFRAP